MEVGVGDEVFAMVGGWKEAVTPRGPDPHPQPLPPVVLDRLTARVAPLAFAAIPTR